VPARHRACLFMTRLGNVAEWRYKCDIGNANASEQSASRSFGSPAPNLNEARC
jgi:hypothetical protein